MSDDILDLAKASQPGAQADAQPDFGADLDALLQDFGAEGPPPKSAPAQAAASPAATQAAPGTAQGAPQTVPMPESMRLGTKPADGHVVDPNEEIELPSLSDLDALLEELGVDDAPAAKPAPAVAQGFDELDAGAQPAPAAQAPGPVEADIESMMNELGGMEAQQPAPQAAPQPVVSAVSIDEDILELDPAQITSAAAPVSAAPQPEPVDEVVLDLSADMAAVHPAAQANAPAQPGEPVLDLTVEMAAVAAPQAAADPVQAPDADIESIIEDVALAVEPEPQMAGPVSQAPADPDPFEAALSAAQPEQAPQAAQPAQPVAEDDGIDMNELDAMLDQVLSVAPRQKAEPSPQTVAEAPAAAAPAQTVAEPRLDVDAAESAPSASEQPPLAAPSVRVEFSVAAEPAAAASLEVPPVDDIDVGAMLDEAAAKQAAATQAVQAGMAEAGEQLPPPPPARATADPAAVSSELAVLKAENVSLREEVAALRSELEALSANIEKYAAQAAARVIREELAALTSVLE